MADQDSDAEDRATQEEIRIDITTDVEFEDEEGTVYAIQTVEEGDRRVDWKIGHIDGTFAEGTDYYYEGERFDRAEFTKMPENAPSGKYKDDRFYELFDLESSFDDGEVTVSKTYDTDGVDTDDWAVKKLEGAFYPETILDEWWEDAMEHHREESA